ncbi:hypothetical protein ABK040_005994 [Willaertia magna]
MKRTQPKGMNGNSSSQKALKKSKTNFNDDTSSMEDESLNPYFDYKSRRLFIPHNVIINKQSSAGIDLRGIAWVLTNDVLYVWSIKQLLTSPSIEAIRLENVPLSENSRKCLITTVIPISKSNDVLMNITNNEIHKKFGILALTPDGKYKYWYNINLDNNMELNNYEDGTINLENGNNISCISPKLSQNGIIYIGNKSGLIIECCCYSEGSLKTIEKFKAFTNEEQQASGLFYWLTQPFISSNNSSKKENLVNILPNEKNIYVLTDNSILKFNDEKTIQWKHNMINELSRISEMKKYDVSLLNITLDNDKLYLLTWCIPKNTSDKDIPLINYLLWPITVTGRISVESPISVFSADYNSELKSLYRKHQIVSSNGRVYVLLHEKLIIISNNQVITTFDISGALNTNIVDIVGLCTVSYNNNNSGCVDLISVQEVSSEELEKEKNLSIIEQIFEESTSSQTSNDTETDFANVLNKTFKKFKKDQQLIPLPSHFPSSAVIRASEFLINGIPTSGSILFGDEEEDTRLSLLILKKLQKKLEDHLLFIEFLQQLNLWGDRLTPKQRAILIEHCEKVCVAIEIRKLQNNLEKQDKLGNALLLDAMKVSCKRNGIDDSLCNHENFFINVSSVGDILPIILEITYNKISTHTKVVNQLFQAFIDGINECKKILIDDLSMTSVSSNWTTEDSTLLVNTFFEQINRSSTTIETSHSVALILNQMYDMADFMFNILSQQQDNNSQTLQFEEKRDAIISIFKKSNDHYESGKHFALTLAEKYKDYKHLIELIEGMYTTKKERHSKYSGYLRRYKDFAKFLFTYLRNKQRYSELLSNEEWNKLYSEEITKAIEGYNNLKYLHFIETERLGDAQVALTDLVEDTNENIVQYPSLLMSRNRLSLLKLISIANNDTKTLDNSSYYLKLSSYQERLSTDLSINNIDTQWSQQPLEKAEDLMRTVYLRIPNNLTLLKENQDKYRERMIIGLEIYNEWEEKEWTGREGNEKAEDILSSLYTACFCVSPKLLEWSNGAIPTNEQEFITESTLYKCCSQFFGTRAQMTQVIYSRVYEFLETNFSERHAKVFAAVFVSANESVNGVEMSSE